jgi:acyl-CoA synthetase (AMP-forming)/AMP-acid ligase II
MKELIYQRHLLAAAQRNASRTVTVNAATGQERTFAEHVDRVARLCGALAGLGLGRGDRFAVMTLNSPEYVELYHAAFCGGGVINPLNLRFAAKELAYVLADSGTKVCFVDAWFAGLIDSVRAEAGLEHVVMVGEGDGPCTARYEELLAAAEPAMPEEGEETDPAVLMYTGGTTGLPKGVLLDQRAELLNVYHCLMRFHMGADSVALLQTPMFHAASMFSILGVPMMDGKLVTVPLFEPEAVMAATERYGCNMTVMVPTMIGMTLAHPNFRPERLSSFEVLVYGASPMPRALLDQVLTLFPDLSIMQGYGMTESSSVLCLMTADDHRRGGALLASAGKAVPGVVLSIQDDEGNLLPAGEIGEVCARGGNYMIEYWNKADATAEAFRGGWYHTGDAGYLDAEGYLYLVDRVKDMIVTGGENVYSVEVENAIASHPGVLQVAVIGVPHETWGEAVHAIVVLREGASATADDIISHARDSIAGYKLPKTVEFRTEPLPLSGAMKVLKRELRKPYWEGKERMVN